MKTWLVFPSTIWGIADTIFVKEGLQKANSLQIPDRIKLAVKLGRAAYVGKGQNLWSHVHIDEGAEFARSSDLMLTLLIEYAP